MDVSFIGLSAKFETTAAALLACAGLAVLIIGLMRQADAREPGLHHRLLGVCIFASCVLFVFAGILAVDRTRTDNVSDRWWMNGYDELQLSQGLVAYRVYSDEEQRWGRWLTLHRPSTALAARRRLSLAPNNGGRCVTSVKISKGVKIRIGRAGPHNDQPGGWSQIEIVGPVSRLTHAKRIRFGLGHPVSTNYTHCGPRRRRG